MPTAESVVVLPQNGCGSLWRYSPLGEEWERVLMAGSL